jgi:hypothetical protein
MCSEISLMYILLVDNNLLRRHERGFEDKNGGVEK